MATEPVTDFRFALTDTLPSTGYTASYPLSAPVTLRVMFEQYISPLFFNGKFDGTTDDTNAIQRAIDEAFIGTVGSFNRYKPMIMPAGQARITAPITVPYSNFVMKGQGPVVTSLLADFVSGSAIVYTGGGDTEFSDFVIESSAARDAAPADANSHGFFSDPGVGNSTIRLKLQNLYSYGHPGRGAELIQPELAEINRCNFNNNAIDGIRLYGRDVPNIENTIRSIRARQNGGWGIVLLNMYHNVLINNEGLNNAVGQMMIDNSPHNTIIEPDLEGFDIVTTGSNVIGLQITGIGNKLIGGDFFGLNKGIRLVNADDTRIIGPELKGKDAGTPMAIGVEMDGGSDRNLIDLPNLQNVTLSVSDAGKTNTIIDQGRPTFATTSLKRVVKNAVSGSITLDFSEGSYFVLNLTGNVTIGAPTNLTALFGQTVEILIVQDATGGRSVTWNAAFKHAWSDTGNAGGKQSAIVFRAFGSLTCIQMAAQGPWV